MSHEKRLKPTVLGVSSDARSDGYSQAMPLTDSAIRNLKPADRPLKLSDGEGLHLFVTERIEALAMKFRVNGREKTR